MLIKSPPSWQMPEREATPEHVFLNRRHFLAALAAGTTTLIGGNAFAAKEADPTADLYPAKRSDGFVLDRPLTKESDAAGYNNFYEFGSHKRIAMEARKLKIRPWTVSFEGLVEKERQVDIDTLIRAMPLEERLYRMRCVEAWSMVIPWIGFPLADLIKQYEPTSKAKFVEFETLVDPDTMPGIRSRFAMINWPYREGLRMDEATNPLTFMAVGLYGSYLPSQNGAPMRLIIPWKYGFKSIKSIVRINFRETQPNTTWNDLQANEYGFYANVNPAVHHPRWRQDMERRLPQTLFSRQHIETRLFNGYGEHVAHMYEGMDLARNY